MVYTCERCGQEFKWDNHYQNHLQRINPCKNKNKIGKKRNIIDQFYTIQSVSENCINQFIETINSNDNDILIEPSAGDGSFSNLLMEKYENVYSYDIDPKQNYIVEQDFFELDITKFINCDNKIHSIGNPPFGRQSSLAKKFIKKCCLFSDTISFILPKSFRKESYQKAFSLNFHLVKEYEILNNAFTIDGEVHHVPCIFQIWEKRQSNRLVEPKPIEEGFHFVKRPKENIIKYNEDMKPIEIQNIFTENPDFGILRAGGGDTCGRISLNWDNGIDCYPEGWLFIKVDNKYDKEKFYNEYQKIDWKDDSNVGARSISKPIFIKGINQLVRTMN